MFGKALNRRRSPPPQRQSPTKKKLGVSCPPLAPRNPRSRLPAIAGPRVTFIQPPSIQSASHRVRAGACEAGSILRGSLGTKPSPKANLAPGEGYSILYRHITTYEPALDGRSRSNIDQPSSRGRLSQAARPKSRAPSRTSGAARAAPDFRLWGERSDIWRSPSQHGTSLCETPNPALARRPDTYWMYCRSLRTSKHER